MNNKKNISALSWKDLGFQFSCLHKANYNLRKPRKSHFCRKCSSAHYTLRNEHEERPLWRHTYSPQPVIYQKLAGNWPQLQKVTLGLWVLSSLIFRRMKDVNVLKVNHTSLLCDILLHECRHKIVPVSIPGTPCPVFKISLWQALDVYT